MINLNLKSLAIRLLLPLFFFLLVANLLTTKTYLMISKDKYDTHENVNWDYAKAADRIMGYLNYKYDNLQGESDKVPFSEQDIKHMKDVRNTYTYIRMFMIISLLIVVANIIYLIKTDKGNLYYALNKIWIFPLIILIFIGGFAIIDFEKIFEIFHRIFFRNNDWFYSESSVLTTMLPTNFWFASTILILVVGSILIILTIILNKLYFRRKLLGE